MTSEAPAIREADTHAATHDRRQLLAIIGGLMIGMFLAALDQTIVATAIRTIGDDLHGLSLQAWVTTAYLITATIATPLYGKLSDIYGRKPFYMLAITLFVIGSLLSATATSMYQLAMYRGLQGIGAGGLMSLAITILGDLMPPRQRAKYQAIFLAVFGVSSVLGPVIGGFFAGTSSFLGLTGWRWVFMVNVPIGVFGLFVIWRVLHLPPVRRVEHRIDWRGALALVVGLVPLLLVAEQGRIWGWSSGSALVCYGLGVVGVIGFIVAERRAGDDALLPLRLFQNRLFSVTAMINVIIGFAMFGALAGLPLYLQIAKGMTPTHAGLALIPFTLGIMTASIIAGQTTAHRGRYKIFPIIGTGLLIVGALLLSRLLVSTPISTVGLYSAVFGMGLGLLFQPLVLAVQNAVPPKDMGTATSSSLFFRQMGGTAGTAVFLSILFSTVGQRIGDAFQVAAKTPDFQAAVADPAVAANPVNAAVLTALKTGNPSGLSLDDSSFIGRLAPQLAAPFKVGFSGAITHIMLIAAVITVIAFVLSFFVPEIPLRTISGLQGRLADEAAYDQEQEAIADEAEWLASSGDSLAEVGAGQEPASDDAPRRRVKDGHDGTKDERA